MLQNIWTWYDSCVFHIAWLGECVKIYDWEDGLTFDEILRYYDATNDVHRIIESSNIWDRVSVLKLNKDWLWICTDITTRRQRVTASVEYIAGECWYDEFALIVWLIRESNISFEIKELVLQNLTKPNVKLNIDPYWKLVITDLWSNIRSFIDDYRSLIISSWNPQ